MIGSGGANADVAVIDGFLDRVRRRIGLLAAAEGAAFGIILCAIIVFATLENPLGGQYTLLVVAALTLLGAGAGLLLSARKRAQTALLVERKAPQCNNLVVTAEQLMQAPVSHGKTDKPPSGETITGRIAPLVFHQAARVVRTLDVSTLLPAKRALILVAGSAVLFTATEVLFNTKSTSVPLTSRGAASGAAVTVQRVDANVMSPDYVKRPMQTLRDPARITALAGSRIALTVASNAASLNVETLAGRQSVVANTGKPFTVSLVADVDGFIAVEPVSASGTKGTRRLIGLTVIPDRAPHVRISAPAKDMMLPDGNRSLDLAIDADDDIALSSLRLKYTHVSGSGERYTFKEGELPLQVSRNNAATWAAKARWNLATLELEPGDMVVYRAVATDARPGAPAMESDSYIAEVLMPGSEAAAGFSIDPDQERYALSQQMIIVKTERLNAKRSTMAPEAFADGANDIAVEQRRVRAEFVFMMGGELADEPLPEEDMTTLHEEAEAEGESDILAGRNANQGRLALVAAIRNMSGAATLLNTANVDEAIVREKDALKQLERAFSHTRIILRALTVAERLDMTRRMTGELLEAGRDTRPSATPDNSPRAVALRGVLAGIAELSTQTLPGTNVATSPAERSSSALALAERVLRVDPSDKALQSIAAQLNNAATALGASKSEAARSAFDVAAIGLTAAIRDAVVQAPRETSTPAGDRMAGALADLLRSSRPSR